MKQTMVFGSNIGYLGAGRHVALCEDFLMATGNPGRATVAVRLAFACADKC
jgi:hypothetical protein